MLKRVPRCIIIEEEATWTKVQSTQRIPTIMNRKKSIVQKILFWLSLDIQYAKWRPPFLPREQNSKSKKSIQLICTLNSKSNRVIQPKQVENLHHDKYFIESVGFPIVHANFRGTKIFNILKLASEALGFPAMTTDSQWNFTRWFRSGLVRECVAACMF